MFMLYDFYSWLSFIFFMAGKHYMIYSMMVHLKVLPSPEEVHRVVFSWPIWEFGFTRRKFVQFGKLLLSIWFLPKTVMGILVGARMHWYKPPGSILRWLVAPIPTVFAFFWRCPYIFWQWCIQAPPVWYWYYDPDVVFPYWWDKLVCYYESGINLFFTVFDIFFDVVQHPVLTFEYCVFCYSQISAMWKFLFFGHGLVLFWLPGHNGFFLRSLTFTPETRTLVFLYFMAVMWLMCVYSENDFYYGEDRRMDDQIFALILPFLGFVLWLCLGVVWGVHGLYVFKGKWFSVTFGCTFCWVGLVSVLYLLSCWPWRRNFWDILSSYSFWVMVCLICPVVYYVWKFFPGTLLVHTANYTPVLWRMLFLKLGVWTILVVRWGNDWARTPYLWYCLSCRDRWWDLFYRLRFLLLVVVTYLAISDLEFEDPSLVLLVPVNMEQTVFDITSRGHTYYCVVRYAWVCASILVTWLAIYWGAWDTFLVYYFYKLPSTGLLGISVRLVRPEGKVVYWGFWAIVCAILFKSRWKAMMAFLLGL